jgi:hypothetical protein
MRVNTLKCNTLYVGRSGDLSSAVSAAAISSLSGVTAGTVTASKALIVDASSDLAGLNDITCGAIDTEDAEALVIGAATATAVTIGATDIVVTAPGVLASGNATGAKGDIRAYSDTTAKGYLGLLPVDNDDNYAVQISNAAMGQAAVISIPDPGAATANFLLTSAANDTVVVAATAAEINEICDASARVVAQAAGNFALAAGTHSGRLTKVEDADVVITLPAATGSGNVYKVLFGLACTGALISVTGNDTFFGGCTGVDDDADAAYAWKAEASDNEVNLNGGSTGGAKGDWFQFTDLKTDEWYVEGFITQSGGSEATPFDAA